MLDEAALLVVDGTICNPINDFKLGGVAFTDTSLSFLVSDRLNPPQQSTLNGAVTQVGFIQWKTKAAFINSRVMSLDQLYLYTRIPAAEVP